MQVRTVDIVGWSTVSAEGKGDAHPLAVCLSRKWLAQRTFAVGITLAASFSVVIVNATLNVIMKRLAVCERHHSMNSSVLSPVCC